MSKTENIQCSFCGRSREEVKILIAGQDGHICEHCIEHAHEVIEKEFNPVVASLVVGLTKISKIKKLMFALVVPVLAFAPQWFFEKKWANFFKPIYLLGILIIGILLVPMSWGLYQQFDLQPGKLINNIPIQSGLRFYYWTQSFGRYTGENYYHEMSYPTFLLENMLWSFLPWIFIFIWAFIAKFIKMFNEGLFDVQTERISFFGFFLTYLVLSRSQAQLPHYIFVVFPLAAVLTAAHFAALLEQADRLHKWIKWFFGFHVFIFLTKLI